MKRTNNVSVLVEICLRSIGMWPNSILPNLHLSIYTTTILILQYHQYMYIIARFDLRNLSHLMDSISLTLANTLSLLKIYSLWWNRWALHNILTAMNRDWNECVSASYGFTMTKTADLSRRCANVLIIVHILAGFSLTIGFYVLHSVKNVNGEIDRELPMKMELYFEVKESPLFECVLIVQFLYQLSLAAAVGMVNALLATLTLHVGGQIDVMQQVVRDMSTNDVSGTSLTVIKDLIRRHQNIISLSNNIEKLYSPIALFQLLWNTMIICSASCLVIISLSKNKDVTAVSKLLFPIIVKILEVFVFCYAGEYLSAKVRKKFSRVLQSKSISDAVYESLWYDMLPSESRMLLLVIVRSQKRLTITAGKVTDLTLEGFTNIMKACVSYMSVLYAMY